MAGFLVDQQDKVPAIGETGVSSQMFCPLIKSACIKQMCLFWVELMAGEQRVAHCAYYWSALQLVDIKQQLIKLNVNLEKLQSGVSVRTPDGGDDVPPQTK
jgi:hypothetical protein